MFLYYLFDSIEVSQYRVESFTKVSYLWHENMFGIKA